MDLQRISGPPPKALAPSGRNSTKVWLSSTLLVCLGLSLGQWIGLSPEPLAKPHAKLADTAQGIAPWGGLQITRIAIERPDEFITVNRSWATTNTWFFENHSVQQVRALLDQKDLSTDQKRVLLDRANWQISSGGILVTPGPTTILSLSPEARARIYRVLSSSGVNYYQRYPFVIRADEVDEWFERNGLSPETDNLVRRLLYRRGDALCFSDIVEALSCIPSPNEKRQVAKMFSRETALLASLHVPEGAEVESLVKYWGKLGQAKDIRPLLESLARTPGGANVDVAHLLPPFARARLYTYPFPSENPIENGHDCFWSSMNFFNAEPEDRFTRFEEVKRTIYSEYYPVQGDPTYGDVVWFVDSNGVAVHSAVYIAKDFFFTKNGSNFNEPWILMDVNDLLAVYAIHSPLRLVAYRLKRV